MSTKKKHSEYLKERRARNRAKGLCACGKEKLPLFSSCQSCKDYLTKAQKLRNIKDRQRVIEAYGTKCSCCGEVEPRFLQLDHIYNDGAFHRKVLKTTNMTRWAVINKFPKILQLLCANCNFAKSFGDCPHKIKVEPV